MTSTARQVDFYHLTRDPVDRLVPLLASKALDGGERLLLVSENVDQIQEISAALWGAGPTSFFAHDFAGCEKERHQQILISEECQPTNGANFVILADGVWREKALEFERTFYLFSVDEIEAAREAWRALSDNDQVHQRYWKQDNGRWVEGP